jgi:uncharacterized damage-inducible protein DinB
MSEIERIADQLKRSFDGGAWHGPAVNEVLRDVSAAGANQRPIQNAHNIRELTLHIGAWENAALRRLNGDRAELTDEEDWAAWTDNSEEGWNRIQAELAIGHQKLLGRIGSLDESQLDQPILAGMSSVYVTLHGVIQHNLYHAGQIAILKKAMTG